MPDITLTEFFTGIIALVFVIALFRGIPTKAVHLAPEGRHVCPKGEHKKNESTNRLMNQ